jgi:hypothetical protein
LALLNFSEHKRQLSGTSRSKLTRKLLLLLAYVLCSEGSRSSPIYSGGRAQRAARMPRITSAAASDGRDRSAHRAGHVLCTSGRDETTNE